MQDKFYLGSSTIPGAYGHNPVLMLPLPDLAGNAVLVWYSMPKAYPMVEGISLLPRYS